jgi:hypothetical protein
VFMLLEEPVLALAGAFVSAEEPLAEAELLLHESEIMLMEVTLREPPPLLSPPERVPWTSTWCPSWGFRVELSPVRVTSWPFCERTQFPPDCFRQPRRTVSWPLEELVGDALLLSVVP